MNKITKKKSSRKSTKKSVAPKKTKISRSKEPKKQIKTQHAHEVNNMGKDKEFDCLKLLYPVVLCPP